MYEITEGGLIMEIRLDCGNWYINGYVIEGDKDIGYSVYAEESESGNMPLFDSESFEECLTWCYNS